MKCYKGFDKDLKCRGFQYELGGEYEEPKADLCNKGFHACVNPLDVFSYYAPSDSRYCEVELEEVSEQRDADSKICGKRIKIGAEIGLKGIVEAGVKFIFDKVDWKNSKISNSGNYSAATNTGDYSVAINSGDFSAATNTGDFSAAEVSGKDSIAIVTGCESRAKAALGCAIVIAERGKWNGTTYPLINIKSAIVDGETIKADTWYTVENNEIVEVR